MWVWFLQVLEGVLGSLGLFKGGGGGREEMEHREQASLQPSCYAKEETRPILSLVPSPFSRGGKKRAWYPLFAHAPDFLGIPRNSILQ